MTVSIGTTVETEATGCQCLRRAENETGKKNCVCGSCLEDCITAWLVLRWMTVSGYTVSE